MDFDTSSPFRVDAIAGRSVIWTLASQDNGLKKGRKGRLRLGGQWSRRLQVSVSPWKWPYSAFSIRVRSPWQWPRVEFRLGQPRDRPGFGQPEVIVRATTLRSSRSATRSRNGLRGD